MHKSSIKSDFKQARKVSRSRQFSSELKREEIFANRITEYLVKTRNIEPDVAWEIGFHLTDWLGDLDDFLRIENVKRWGSVTPRYAITNLLVHATAHLMAAHRLLLKNRAEDIFDKSRELPAMKRKNKRR